MHAYFTEEGSVDAVNARMGRGYRPAARHRHGEPRPAPARLRQGGRAHSRKREYRHRLPDQDRSDLLGRAAGVHPALRYARLRCWSTRSTTVVRPVPPRTPSSARSTSTARRSASMAARSRSTVGETWSYEGRVIRPAWRADRGRHRRRWSDNADGFYDVQQPGIQPKWNNRGRFVTGSDGKYSFVGIQAGQLPDPRRRPGRPDARPSRPSPYRPAHMHYLVTAPGFQKVVTHTFVGEDPYRIRHRRSASSRRWSPRSSTSVAELNGAHLLARDGPDRAGPAMKPASAAVARLPEESSPGTVTSG